jgi:hypothetical protein
MHILSLLHVLFECQNQDSDHRNWMFYYLIILLMNVFAREDKDNNHQLRKQAKLYYLIYCKDQYCSKMLQMPDSIVEDLWKQLHIHSMLLHISKASNVQPNDVNPLILQIQILNLINIDLICVQHLQLLEQEVLFLMEI